MNHGIIFSYLQINPEVFGMVDVVQDITEKALWGNCDGPSSFSQRVLCPDIIYDSDVSLCQLSLLEV